MDVNASVRCEQKRLQRLSETVPANNRSDSISEFQVFGALGMIISVNFRCVGMSTPFWTLVQEQYTDSVYIFSERAA